MSPLDFSAAEGKTGSSQSLSNDDIFLVRHAQSQGQVDQTAYKTCGDLNIPITDLGRQQAIAAGKILNTFEEASKTPLSFYSGTGVRTRQTAAGILSALSFPHRPDTAFDARLDKQDFGSFDGLFTKEERQEADPAAYAQYEHELETRGEFYARPPGGESIADVYNRVSGMLEEIKANRRPAVIVSHGLQLLCAEAILTGKSKQWILDHQDTVQNCSIKQIRGGQSLMSCDNPFTCDL